MNDIWNQEKDFVSDFSLIFYANFIIFVKFYSFYRLLNRFYKIFEDFKGL